MSPELLILLAVGAALALLIKEPARKWPRVCDDCLKVLCELYGMPASLILYKRKQNHWFDECSCCHHMREVRWAKLGRTGGGSHEE